MLWSPPTAPAQAHHFVFYGQDREKLAADTSLFATNAFQGAQVAYSWRQLEPAKDEYDFSLIREDLALLSARGKKLFVQFQDVTFSPSRINVPRYLLADSSYHGGVAKQYRIPGDDERRAIHEGWVARRWDPAVQARLYALFNALGKEFDGRIEGINLAETSVTFGETGRLFPEGFTHAGYRDAIIANMAALKRAFPKSVAMVYANFMPGEFLAAVYRAARALSVGVGGPDLLPSRPWQRSHSYPLIRESSGLVPTGIAVQDGNLADVDPSTGRPVTAPQLLAFATEYLKVDYIFWGIEEPYYSGQVVPLVRRVK